MHTYIQACLVDNMMTMNHRVYTIESWDHLEIIKDPVNYELTIGKTLIF